MRLLDLSHCQMWNRSKLSYHNSLSLGDIVHRSGDLAQRQAAQESVQYVHTKALAPTNNTIATCSLYEQLYQLYITLSCGCSNNRERV